MTRHCGKSKRAAALALVATLAAPAAAVGAWGAASAWASAQQQQQGPFTEATLRGSGRGALRLAGRAAEPLRAVDIQLKAGGDAEISVTGERTYTARGRWRGRGADTVLLHGLTGDFINQPMRGQGTIRLDEKRRFARLDLDGTVNNRRFSVDFSRVGGVPAPFRELRSRNSGRGELIAGNQAPETLALITVTLTQEGLMQVEARTIGNDVRTFTGRWTPVSATAATLDVTDGLGRAGARGSGKVTLTPSGAGLARVDIRGETQNEPFTLRFAADGNAPQP